MLIVKLVKKTMTALISVIEASIVRAEKQEKAILDKSIKANVKEHQKIQALKDEIEGVRTAAAIRLVDEDVKLADLNASVEEAIALKAKLKALVG